jgi:hypothetical protein
MKKVFKRAEYILIYLLLDHKVKVCKNVLFLMRIEKNTGLGRSYYRIEEYLSEQKNRTFGRKSIDFPHYRLYAERARKEFLERK